MKKNKHITVSLEESTFQEVEQRATEEERPIADICRRLIKKALKEEQ